MGAAGKKWLQREARRRPRRTRAEIDAMIAAGYRRVSNAHGTVARIDRADWREVLAEKMMRSIKGFANAADHYRRVYSADTLDLHWDDAQLIPQSENDPTGFCPTE